MNTPEPPLHQAARAGDLAAIRALVRDGADVNALSVNIESAGNDPPMVTPLMVAASSRTGADVETVKALLELGADVTRGVDPSRGRHSMSPALCACRGLDWSFQAGDAARLELLLNVERLQLSDLDDPDYILCGVAGSGDAARLRVLLEHGMNPAGYWTPERGAASFQMLYRRVGAFMSPEERESFRAKQEMCLRSAPFPHDIPLFCAAESGDAECVRLLIAAGADPKVRDNSKRTALYYAHSTPVARELIAAGLKAADSDDTDEFQYTPIQHALSSRGEHANAQIRALIEAGVDVNQVVPGGESLFLWAVWTRCPLDAIVQLVSAGADPHTLNKEGGNALHAALIYTESLGWSPEVVRYLHSIGVALEQHRTYGGTPLACAVADEDGPDAVRLLCELGADANARFAMPHGERGYFETTVLARAATNSWKRAAEVVRILLDAGADPLAAESAGATPMRKAIETLCARAPACEALAARFETVLRDLKLVSEPQSNSLDACIASWRPLVRATVERLALEHLPPSQSEYTRVYRESKLECITLLCIAEARARATPRSV